VAIVIPDKPSTPLSGVLAYNWLLHGWPKTGKTQLASQFPRPIFLQTQVGTKSMSVFGVPVTNWDECCEFLTELEAKTDRFDTVVVDTAERLYDFLCEQVASDHNVDNISSMKYGSGWAEVQKRMTAYLEILAQLKKCVVLISHTRTIKDDSGAVEIDRVVPNLGDSARKIVVGWVDVCLYTAIRHPKQKKGGDKTEEEQEDEFIAVCRPRPGVEAGGRLRYLPPEILLSPTPADGYARLAAAVDESCERQLAELRGSSPAKTPKRSSKKGK